MAQCLMLAQVELDLKVHGLSINRSFAISQGKGRPVSKIPFSGLGTSGIACLSIHYFSCNNRSSWKTGCNCSLRGKSALGPVLWPRHLQSRFWDSCRQAALWWQCLKPWAAVLETAIVCLHASATAEHLQQC